MGKKLALIAAMLLTIGFAGNAQAATISGILPEFNGDLYFSGFPYNYHVGNFSYTIPAGETITSATLSGQWGNNANFTSADNELYLDNILVANTRLAAHSPYNYPNVQWTYTFSDFSVLSDGNASFDMIQTSRYIARLGKTVLVIQTAPSSTPEPSPAPEPSSMVLGLMGLGSMLGFRRKKN